MLHRCPVELFGSLPAFTVGAVAGTTGKQTLKLSVHTLPQVAASTTWRRSASVLMSRARRCGLQALGLFGGTGDIVCSFARWHIVSTMG